MVNVAWFVVVLMKVADLKHAAIIVANPKKKKKTLPRESLIHTSGIPLTPLGMSNFCFQEHLGLQWSSQEILFTVFLKVRLLPLIFLFSSLPFVASCSCYSPGFFQIRTSGCSP